MCDWNYVIEKRAIKHAFSLKNSEFKPFALFLSRAVCSHVLPSLILSPEAGHQNSCIGSDSTVLHEVGLICLIDVSGLLELFRIRGNKTVQFTPMHI